jgi:hypothetical protein
MEPEGSLPHSQEPATCPYLTYSRKLNTGLADHPSNLVAQDLIQ